MTSLIENNWNELSKYVDPRLQGNPCLFKFPTIVRYNAGRQLDWDFFSLPGLNNRENWTAEAEKLIDGILIPLFQSISGPGDVAEFLLRSDGIFLWIFSDSVSAMRVMEIMLLAIVSGWDKSRLEELLSLCNQRLKADTSGGLAMPLALARLVELSKCARV